MNVKRWFCIVSVMLFIIPCCPIMPIPASELSVQPSLSHMSVPSSPQIIVIFPFAWLNGTVTNVSVRGRIQLPRLRFSLHAEVVNLTIKPFDHDVFTVTPGRFWYEFWVRCLLTKEFSPCENGTYVLQGLAIRMALQTWPNT